MHLNKDGMVLELFNYYESAGKNVASCLRQFDYGLIHIGFEVSDFHNQVEALRKRGVEFLGEPIEFRPDVWIVYFRGPDGEVCEFRQRPVESS